MYTPIAASLTRQATTDLATSALPCAPVRPEPRRPGPARRVRQRLRGPLTRLLARPPARPTAATDCAYPGGCP
jgi:hypothetical protein